MAKLLWHYTNGTNIDKILAEGRIKLAVAGIKRPEKGVAWFSSNPVWDASANRGNVQMKKADYQPGVVFDAKPSDWDVKPFDATWMDKNMGRFRIGVIAEAAPHDWKTLKKLANIPHEVALSMERANKAEFGDPAEWYGSLTPVLREQWRTVERMERGIWVKHVDLGFAVEGMSSEGGRWGRN